MSIMLQPQTENDQGLGKERYVGLSLFIFFKSIYVFINNKKINLKKDTFEIFQKKEYICSREFVYMFCFCISSSYSSKVSILQVYFVYVWVFCEFLSWLCLIYGFVAFSIPSRYFLMKKLHVKTDWIRYINITSL